MSPDNPTQILTTHDLSNLRSLPSVTTASIAAAAVATTPITFGNNHNQNQNNHNNVVLSTIPLFIQQSPLVSTTATTLANNNSNNNNQQQRTIGTNGLRTNTNINSLLAAAGTKATIVSTNNNHSSNTIKNGNNMPTTSKYVFLQQNGNGQFTTFEGTTTTVNNSSNTRNNNNNTVSNNNVGNIVLLATEPMELTSGNHTEQQHIITTSGGDNDEELRPLAWLNDTNLIKGIVATSATNIIGGTQQNNSGNNKRTLGSNICIVNASNAHDLIEELPQHVANEEQVATTTTTGNNQNDLSETQITTLSVSDFQQQFIASNKRFGLTCLPLSQQETISGAASNAVTIREQQSIYNNIPAIDATTTVHVGPSGTTTLVEYKSNANFIPAQRQLLSNNVGNNIVNNATTITATNLSITNNNNNSTTTNSNNYVPSSSNSTTTSSNTSHNPATSSLQQTNKTLTLPNTILTANTSATNANGNIVANSNNTTNTIYQGQKQHSNGTTSTSTTHHPHKKYLREKMNVLDHGGGGGGGGTTTVAGLPSANGGISTITVSSPASSNNSMSSSASSTPSSTAAVNGDNSPISKSFFSLGSIGIAAIGNNFSNSSSHSVAASSPASSDVASVKSNVFTSNKATSFTIVNPTQHIVTSAMSSPEPPNSKDFFTLVTPQHHQQQQQQAMRSPTSYSSYDNDSLKDFEICTSSPASSGARLTTSTPQQSHNNSQQHSTPKTTAHNNNSTTPQKQKHPNNVPYDPQVHTHNKPPYSFSSLIFMAIEGSNEKALPVKEIYAWIVQHFPYFKTAPTGWKNSVRHNLSLNKSFVKVEKAPNMGKGSLWRVEQQQRQNLIQALTRSPFFPNSAVDKIALKSPSGGIGINNANSNDYDPVEEKSSNTHINPRFDPRLFPNLSKAFKDMSEHNVLNDVVSDVPDDDIPSDYSTTNNPNLNHKNNYNYSTSLQNGGGSIMGAFSNFESIERLARECGADSIDDVNAATAMLALKHGPKVFSETFQNGAPVITSSPSEDHTYSAGGSGASTPLTNGNTQSVINGNIVSNGNIRQNGCDNQSNCASSDAAYESSEENHNITPEELEDQQRHRDGVDALLSLSLSSVMDSPSSCSPIKRPSSTTVDEEHISSYMESAKKSPPQHHHVGKIALISNATVNTYNTNQLQTHHQNNNHNQQLQHHLIFNDGYNAQSYFSNTNNNNHNIHHLSTSLPPKKLKPLRSLRTKIKRKAQWMR